MPNEDDELTESEALLEEIYQLRMQIESLINVVQDLNSDINSLAATIKNSKS